MDMWYNVPKIRFLSSELLRWREFMILIIDLGLSKSKTMPETSDAETATTSHGHAIFETRAQKNRHQRSELPQVLLFKGPARSEVLRWSISLWSRMAYDCRKSLGAPHRSS